MYLDTHKQPWVPTTNKRLATYTYHYYLGIKTTIILYMSAKLVCHIEVFQEGFLPRVIYIYSLPKLALATRRAERMSLCIVMTVRSSNECKIQDKPNGFQLERRKGEGEY